MPTSTPGRKKAGVKTQDVSKGKFSQFFVSKPNLEKATIDFSKEIPSGQDAFLTILRNEESQYFDFQRLKSPKVETMSKIKPKKKKTGDEDEVLK